MTTQAQNNVVEKLRVPAAQAEPMGGDEFLGEKDLVPVGRSAAERSLKRALAELAALMAENRWEDILELFHPAADKLPELVPHGLDPRVRSRVAFALGQLKRFDEAIAELRVCVEKEPQDFLYHSSLAYAAYNSIYSAKNREVFLRGKPLQERIALAHRHFSKAQELRPGGVTNFYRQGMLIKQIEGKPEKALAYFEKAVSNWTGLTDQEKEVRHQERKNFVKALYHMAASLLAVERAEESLVRIRQCLTEDDKTNHMDLVFKYFALGKVFFHLNRFPEARDALLFAGQCHTTKNRDFVFELLARTYLAMGSASKAAEALDRVPETKRRPYYRWTEADVHCALGQYERAKLVLIAAQERDGRSKHKALIRLAKLEYLLGSFERAGKWAAAATSFFQEKWGSALHEGLFWQALCAYRLGDLEKAGGLASELKACCPHFPKLHLLLNKIAAAGN